MIAAYILAVRPKTLVAAVVPIVSAAVLAYSNAIPVSSFTFISAVVCALSLQIATNLFNDVIDFKKGADDHHRIGPQRVTQSGLMSQKQVLGMALCFVGLATISGIPLVILGGAPFLILGLMSLFLAYSYTGGPFPLAYLGIGDFFVTLFFGLVAVCGSYFIFTGDLTEASCVLGLQVGFLATVLLAVNNLRDSATDSKVGKKTLAVRFGDKFVKLEIVCLISTTFALTFYWILKYQKVWFLIVFFGLPLAYKIARDVWRNDDKKKLNKILSLSGALMIVFCVLQWSAFIL